MICTKTTITSDITVFPEVGMWPPKRWEIESAFPPGNRENAEEEEEEEDIS
jgi:hypothetical protein